MNWFDWVVVGIWLLAIVGTVSSVGKMPRIMTQDRAAGQTVTLLVFIGLMLFSHGVFN